MLRLLFVLCFTFTALASDRTRPSQLLRCLGVIEEKLHKAKDQGPFYDLNQRLINELIQTPGIEGTPQVLNALCNQNPRSSMRLLQSMLLEKNQWYQLSSTGHRLHDNINQELIKELNAVAPEILLNFLAALQATSPTADCLEKNIPGISRLYSEVRWLQEELNLEKIVLKKKRLIEIFDQIQNVEAYFQSCRKEKSKKTASPAGNPSDKKSPTN